MSKEAAEYIRKLSEDPSLREAHKDDPEGSMAKAGLSEEDKKVIQSGDEGKIRAHMGDHSPPGCMVMVLV